MLVITEWYKFRLNVRKIKLPASDAFRFKMISAEISANQDKIKIIQDIADIIWGVSASWKKCLDKAVQEPSWTNKSDDWMLRSSSVQCSTLFRIVFVP